MRAMVTGATGFVGRHLVRALLDAGHEVTAVHRASSAVDRLEGMAVRRVVADLAQPDALKGTMDGVDWLFHVAADLSWWRGGRRRQWAVNVEGTRRVVAEALRARVKRLVYTSSVAAIGFPGDHTVADESFPFNGHRLGIQYAISKWEGERRVLEAAGQGLDAVIVNPSTILGDGMSGPDTVVAMVVRRALPGWTTGGTNFCFIDDVVRGHVLAAERGVTGRRYILGGHNVTFRDLLTALARAAGVEPPRRGFPPAAVRAAAWAMDLGAFVRKSEPALTRDHARLVGREMYYSSALAQDELGYEITAFPQVAAESVRRYVDASGRRLH